MDTLQHGSRSSTFTRYSDPHGNRARQPESLAELIAVHIKRDRRSINRIAIAAQIDGGYLWRLQSGHKHRPSRDVLIRLGLVLGLEPDELDEILVAADLAPITWRRW
jgi:hypothetical protein